MRIHFRKILIINVFFLISSLTLSCIPSQPSQEGPIKDAGDGKDTGGNNDARILSVTPSPLRIQVGMTETLKVVLTKNRIKKGSIGVQISDPSIVKRKSPKKSVDVMAEQNSVNIEFTGESEGQARLVLSLEGNQLSTQIIVFK